MRVRDARDAYLAENGFTLAGYDAAWTEASLLGVMVPIGMLVFEIVFLKVGST
jgi:hypothetical protein